MNAGFFEAVFGLMETIWLMVVAGVMLFTTPIWIVPYTAYKIWMWWKK